MKLSLATLKAAAPSVRTPTYDVARLGAGMVHLGVGAFHRAHQAIFTDDAIEAAGGDWGVVGVSMRQPDVANALSAQDGLYTVETLDEAPSYRVAGAIRATLTLPQDPEAVLAAIADPAAHIVTLTVTEKGYCLAGGTLDLQHPDILHDLAHPHAPRSAIGALAQGLAARQRHGAPMTIISCDNMVENGARLGRAVHALAERLDPGLAAWIETSIAFPETMVDSIVPATDAASRARVAQALGLTDEASVQREPYGQWVIEDRFAGPRPAWDQVGAQIVADVAPHRRLKLHVLNATHSALAYLGLARGHEFVHQAMGDAQIQAFLEDLVETELAPGLPGLPVRDYWAKTARRFANPMVDHRLAQIAQDGGLKLAERVYPVMIANARDGLPIARLGAIVRAWLEHMGAGSPGLDLLPQEIQRDPILRAAILGAAQ
ncbi:mannitol dehydrogenase family protein [Phenylobacterium sp. Root700]|uniref:mannitol dehydrogenase family protein n=1 Tax=Phenylobacterium sp. Root700 TaxID=1736591 RepID=UPI0006F4BEDA|nr:mannitol dehydrogenase family protein [Phenylobacterium sp. Root700]KRB48841.1 hypothetical protein ASE02_00635 [Phenylobacterium sp. Root700]